MSCLCMCLRVHERVHERVCVYVCVCVCVCYVCVLRAGGEAIATSRFKVRRLAWAVAASTKATNPWGASGPRKGGDGGNKRTYPYSSRVCVCVCVCECVCVCVCV
jgi:hypothetical protein